MAGRPSLDQQLFGQCALSRLVRPGDDGRRHRPQPLGKGEKLGVLHNLLRVLARRAGGFINEADIARSVGLNAVTAKSYRILLQMMFLIFDVRPWFRNTGTRLVKSPKGYIADTALLTHLQQIDLKKTMRSDPHLFGGVFENFVASELSKLLAHSGGTAKLLHWRTSDNKEIDFVLERSAGALTGSGRCRLSSSGSNRRSA